MSVIVIGDQAVGKTTLMLELAKSNRGKVQVISPSLDDLENKYTLNGFIKPTQGFSNQPMELKVNLGSNSRLIKVNWVDSAGEFWRSDSPLRHNQPQQWNWIRESLHNAQNVMWIIAPYRSLLQQNLLAQDGLSKTDPRFRNLNQWKIYFEQCIKFLNEQTTMNQCLLICLNMADLFCDTQKIGMILEQQNRLDWLKHKQNILPIFNHVKHLISYYDNNRLVKSQLFLTTYKNRNLLELPWRYIAS